MSKLNLGRIGFGCMKASFSASEDNRQSTIEAIHFALDQGVRLFDTADIYAPSWDTFGHNERLVAQAVNSHPFGGEAIIATKSGITRKPGEVWGRNASLDYLLRAVEASCGRLGVNSLTLWQHHRLDPNLTFEEQIDNIAGLKTRGLIQNIGVSNYSAKQLRRAVEVFGPITSVQNQLSPSYRQELEVLEVCEEFDIAYLPWSPMKGAHPKDASAELTQFAKNHNASTYAVTVAWLTSLSTKVIPLPGITRIESVRDALSGLDLQLHGEFPLQETLPMDAELLSDQPKS